MVKKDLVINLSVEALKTAIVLLTLLFISRFIESLPFSGLPVFNSLITAADVLAAFISAAAITVFIKAGLNAKVVVDELLHWLPGAGTLLNYLTGIIALLFAYSAFQTVVFPFIKELEWAYQALFLAGTLFLLAKVGIHIYGASESVSRFLISIFHPHEVKAGPGIENK
ncbi:MAG: hypothetical protein WCK75_05320 [Elusimicrobiota bacterium]